MSTRESDRTLVPISFNASNVVQLLTAMACFLAAFVLPPNFPELEGPVKYFLIILGAGFLGLMALSILLRPWLNAMAQKIGIRSRMLLPREGIVYLGIMLVIAVAALTGGNPDTGNMLLLIFGMMAGPFVFNGWVVMGMLSRVSVSRHLPISVSAGTFFSVEIRLRNEKRILASRLVEVRDVIQGNKISSEGKVIFVRVLPGEQRSTHYDVCISRRGLYHFGPMRLSSRFPLGIGERGHAVSSNDQVIVHPKIGRLLPAWKRREQELAETASRENARLGLFEDEFHGIREYRSGDNPRSIHWRSSARHGHFMVKEHEQHREADLIVLLDLYATANFSEALQELAISLAATICVEQTRRSSSGHYRIMIAGKDLQNVECAGSGRFRDEALKELAICEASPKAQLAAMLLAVCQSHLAPHSRFVLITPRPAAARLLADSIAQENLQHEQQFIGRLMIVNADATTLNSTLAMDVDTIRVPFSDSSNDSGTADATSVDANGNRPLAHTAAAKHSELRSLAPVDQKLQSTFLRSVTLTTAIAGLVLCQSEGSFFPAALTPVFAVIAWILVDQLKWVHLPTWMANILGLAAFVVSGYEFTHGGMLGKLSAGGHMLVYLMCIVLMMRKEHRQYWWLLALTLLQMAVSAILNAGVFFGVAMLVIMAMMLWTLSVFSLYRVMDLHVRHKSRGDSERHNLVSEAGSSGTTNLKTFPASIQVRDGLQRDSSETWIGWRFRGMVAGAFIVSLVLAAFVFAAFPRIRIPGSATFAGDEDNRTGSAARSGFNETIRLGQLGRIAISQQRVLSFSVSSLKTSQPVTADQFAAALDMDEVRFRGNTLGKYNHQHWNAGFSERRLAQALDPQHEATPDATAVPEFQVRITLDPPLGDYLFTPYPVLNVTSAVATALQSRPISGALVFAGKVRADQPFRYTVACPRIEPLAADRPTFAYWMLPHDAAEDDANERVRFLNRRAQEGYLTPDIDHWLPLLHQFSNQLCIVNGRRIPAEDRVKAVMRFLSAENGFAYSTNQTRRDLSVDPVEDFVFNTKSGHCEYFASACALMLQSVNVPARLVNGYSGCDLNSVTGDYEIRQKHAHTWVEVFLNNRWETLDPTPAASRRESIASVAADSLVNNLQTAISDLWNDGIHKMSAERQKEFFAPVISTSKSMLETIRKKGIMETLWNGMTSFVSTPEAWISWRGGVATFLMLLFGACLSRLHPLEKLTKFIRSVVEQFSGKQRTRKSIIRFYAQFCFLCEQHGMPLSASDSALENSRAAIDRFGAKLNSPDLQNLPLRIAAAFNAVRFGKAELTDEQAASIGKDLTFFANALSSGQTSGT